MNNTMRECQIIHSIPLWSINAPMNATSRKKCSSRRSLLIMKAPSWVWHNLTCSGFLYHQSSYLLGMLLQFTSLEHLQRSSVCNPAKIFFTSKFSYTLCSNPTHKTETGIANSWGTTNSKPAGPIIMMGQSEN